MQIQKGGGGRKDNITGGGGGGFGERTRTNEGTKKVEKQPSLTRWANGNESGKIKWLPQVRKGSAVWLNRTSFRKACRRGEERTRQKRKKEGDKHTERQRLFERSPGERKAKAPD